MAHIASDGTKFTNLPPMKAHQRGLDAKKQTDPLQMPGQGGGEEGDDSPEAVVAEHGPAQEVHVTHDHEAGTHHVHSVHGDAHETHSDHGSVEEAHEHGKALASGGDEPDDEDELGGMDDAEFE